MSHTQRLREAAKFFSGLVLGDFLGLMYFVSYNLLPMKFMGIEFTAQLAWLGGGFDILLFLVLIHYAWHPKVLEPSISRQSLFYVIGAITAIVALVHLFRLIFGWQFIVGDWIAPMWLSWVGVIVAAFVSYASFHFASRK